MADAKDARRHRNSGPEMVAGDLPKCCASSIGGGKKQDQNPGLSAGEELNLQKQILDLQEQLHEFWRPVGGGDT